MPPPDPPGGGALVALAPPAPFGTRPARAGPLVLAWAGMAALLLAELLFLTVRHDTAPFAGRGDFSGRLLAAAPTLLRIAVSSAVVVLALTAWRLRGRFGQAVRDLGLVPGLWPWLPAHLAAFALLAHTSDRLFGSPLLADWRDAASWWAAVACTGLFWVAAAVPPRFWPGLVRTGRQDLAAGFSVGLGGWAVSELTRSGWASASEPTFWAVTHLLRLVRPEVVSDPETFLVGTPAFLVTIAPSCSGYEGIGLVVLYASAYLCVFRRHLRFPHALALLPLGALAAWSLNAVRIAALVVIGDSRSPELALGGFHSQAGWLAFNAVALGLAFLAHRLRLFTPHPDTPEASPTAAYLTPLLALIVVQMLTRVFFNGSPALYPLHILAGASVLAYHWRSIDGLGRPTPRDHREPARGGVLGAVLAGVGVFALWEGLPVLAPPGGTPDDPRQALSGWPAWAVVVWAVGRAAGSVVVVPLLEEVAFRGYLLRRLTDHDFRSVSPRRFAWRPLVTSSVLFGVLHENWAGGIVAGLAYAAVYASRGRLGDAVLAHATTNGLLTVAALATGDWQYWS